MTKLSHLLPHKDKLITVYPTYAYADGGSWTFKQRVWVHKPRRADFIPDKLIRRLLDDEGTLKESEILRCRECIEDFVADDDSGEDVAFTFDGDSEVFRFSDETSGNGLVEQKFTLSDARIHELLGKQNSTGWLTLKVKVSGHEGRGRVRVIEGEGLSVVSDIDDTIKVSEIPAGGKIILRNTFLRDYVPAPKMLERYKAFGDVSFHYVSGSPWQLFRLLHTFLIEKGGFPEGTFHMKSLSKNLLDISKFLEDIKNFVSGKTYTQQQKIGQISELMQNLPRRKFYLIGDSGELDPEVFLEIRKRFPAQVEKIMIRDVVDAKTKTPQRLAGIDEIIEAGHPFITHGVTQFKD